MWWIIWAPDAPSGEPSYTVMQGTQAQAAQVALKIVAGKATGPYTSQAAAESAAKAGTGKPPSTSQASNQPSVPGAGAITTWLQGLGGQIGSGIEAALVSFLKDLWAVILGPLEIIAGVALAILIVVWMFKDDLAAAAMLFA